MRLVVAEAASDHSALLEVGRAALARVAAHAVLSTAGLQDGLSGNGLPVLYIHEQPEDEQTVRFHQARPDLTAKPISPGVIAFAAKALTLLYTVSLNLAWRQPSQHMLRALAHLPSMLHETVYTVQKV